jgi:hypothetical protein
MDMDREQDVCKNQRAQIKRWSSAGGLVRRLTPTDSRPEPKAPDPLLSALSTQQRRRLLPVYLDLSHIIDRARASFSSRTASLSSPTEAEEREPTTFSLLLPVLLGRHGRVLQQRQGRGACGSRPRRPEDVTGMLLAVACGARARDCKVSDSCFSPSSSPSAQTPVSGGVALAPTPLANDNPLMSAPPPPKPTQTPQTKNQNKHRRSTPPPPPPQTQRRAAEPRRRRAPRAAAAPCPASPRACSASPQPTCATSTTSARSSERGSSAPPASPPTRRPVRFCASIVGSRQNHPPKKPKKTPPLNQPTNPKPNQTPPKQHQHQINKQASK